MLNVVLLIVVVVVGTILAYPCAFKRGVFRDVRSERCIKPERTSKFVTSGEYLPTKNIVANDQ